MAALDREGTLYLFAGGWSLLTYRIKRPAGAGAWTRIRVGTHGVLLLEDRGEIYFVRTSSGNLPVIVELLLRPAAVRKWQDLDFGEQHFLGLSDDGQLYSSGSNLYGQLGSGDATGQDPGWRKVVMPPGVTAWTSFAAGRAHSMAVGNDCSLYGWGWNGGGELGIPASGSVFQPTRTTTVDGVCGSMLVFMRNAATRLEDGTFKLAFPTLQNRNYFVQYSDDFSTWRTAFPPIVGTGNTVEWIDAGPPATDSSAADRVGRWYRILLAP